MDNHCLVSKFMISGSIQIVMAIKRKLQCRYLVSIVWWMLAISRRILYYFIFTHFGCIRNKTVDARLTNNISNIFFYRKWTNSAPPPDWLFELFYFRTFKPNQVKNKLLTTWIYTKYGSTYVPRYIFLSDLK